MLPPSILRHRLALVLAIATLLGRTSPSAADTWTFVGLDRENVAALVVDPSYPQMWAGLIGHFGSSSGVWYSNDGGVECQQVNLGLGDPHRPPDVLALAIAPHLPEVPVTLYAGTAEDGVYKAPNGVQWFPARDGMAPGPLRINSIVVDPSNEQVVYAASSTQGVYKTTNGGGLWIGRNTGLPELERDILALAIDPQHPQTLYALTWGEGVYKTTDGGENWTAANNGLGRLIFSDILSSLVIDPSDSQTLYLSMDAAGVFKSTDGAASWNAVNDGLAEDDLESLFLGLGIDDDSPQVVYVGGSFADSAVFRSGNGGAQWSSDGFDGATIVSFVDDPSVPHKLFAATTNGIFTVQPSTSDSGCSMSPRGSTASAAWLLVPLLLALLARRARRWQ